MEESMSAGAIKSLISSERMYPPELYQAAEKGSHCRNEKIGVASTNVVMRILKEAIIDPLSRIPGIDQEKGAIKLNADTSSKIKEIFRAIGFIPKKVDEGLSLERLSLEEDGDKEDRKDLAHRAANLFRSEYSFQLKTISFYISRSENLSKEESFQRVVALSSDSLSDVIGRKALDVFKVGRAAAEQERAVAEQERAAAKQERAAAEANLARAKALLERRDELMMRALHILNKEIAQGTI
jgi:hypothetical protein